MVAAVMSTGWDMGPCGPTYLSAHVAKGDASAPVCDTVTGLSSSGSSCNGGQLRLLAAALGPLAVQTQNMELAAGALSQDFWAVLWACFPGLRHLTLRGTQEQVHGSRLVLLGATALRNRAAQPALRVVLARSCSAGVRRVGVRAGEMLRRLPGAVIGLGVE